ncbi:hypothetical protein COCVIDRAFT_31860 [Bipolaris victoriae FI3]|uniref:DNA 3'-5' helicase n=1 Tax=Bipolaris victoriae (strain FI3) TaxID=930091 RepID=W7DRC2_BIPV3|nr:hypothetical protein COCVIDRAFT_31860 [Bipolaris victoriae FI3]
MRHLIIAFGRKLDEARGRGTESGIYFLTEDETEEALDDEHSEYRELQAGYSPNTAIAVYGLTVASVFRMRYAAPQAHLRVSIRWHGDLGYSSIRAARSDSKALSSNAVSRMREREAKRGRVDVNALLQTNLGQKTMFRGRQQEVVNAILACTPVVSYIAGTGSGKSLAFLLPACCKGYGQAIVITPLVALREDIQEHCQNLYISCSVWGDTLFNETSRLILAMPEHLRDSRFLDTILRLRDVGQLERIVVDEFHYVLLPDHEYRPALLQIRELARYQVPLTLLSATIPFAEEQQAYQLFGVDGQVTVFRQSTSRSNLVYEVHTYEGQMQEEERRKNQRGFLASKSGIMVATTAFNAGVNVPDIRGVIRLGEPDHPITWSQEAGRGGRDGKRCVVRILLGDKLKSFFHKLGRPEQDVLNAIMLRSVEAKQTCMRIAIDAYLDGPTSRQGCHQDEEPCQVCAARAEARQATTSTKGKAPLRPEPQSTPVRTEPPILMSRSPHSNPRAQGSGKILSSSPAVYELSSPPVWQPQTLKTSAVERVDEEDGAWAVLRAALERRGSPMKRHRDQVSISEISPTPSSSSAQRAAKTARTERTLEYISGKAARAGQESVMLASELQQTGAYWREHCVSCFVAQQAFDHPKDTAEGCEYTSPLVKHFRFEKMKKRMGSGFCFSCLFPQSQCGRWIDGNGLIRNYPDSREPCTYPHVIADAWAVLWAACPGMRKRWVERILASDANCNLDNNEDFANYFRGGQYTRKAAASRFLRAPRPTLEMSNTAAAPEPTTQKAPSTEENDGDTPMIDRPDADITQPTDDVPITSATDDALAEAIALVDVGGASATPQEEPHKEGPEAAKAGIQPSKSQKRRREKTPDSNEESDDEAPVDMEEFSLELDTALQHVEGLRDEDLTHDAAGCEGESLFTANIENSTLGDVKFGDWIGNRRKFVTQVLKLPYNAFQDLILENQRIEHANKLLLEHVAMGVRSCSLSAVRSIMAKHDTGVLVTEPEEHMKNWAPELHWARFLCALKLVFVTPDNSVFDQAKIKGDTTTDACLWIISKIIASELKPKRLAEIKMQKDAEKRKATERHIIQTMQQRLENATYKVDAEAAKQAALRSIKALNRDHTRQTRRTKAAKTVHSVITVSDEEDDLALEDELDEAPATTPANPSELTDEEIVASYVAEMEKVQAKQARDPAYRARIARAARNLKDLVRDLKARPLVHNAYVRDMAILHRVALYHLEQIRTVPKCNKRKNPILKALKAMHALSKQTAMLISREVEQEGIAGNDILNTMAREEATGIRQRATGTTPTKGEELPDMVEIPKEEQPDPSADLFQNARISKKFNPDYLREACIEASIINIYEKLIPDTNVALRWWQIIATKWATDLSQGVISSTAMQKLNRVLPPVTRPQCPERPGEKCRPTLYITNSSLCHQAATDLSKFSNKFRVVHVGGNVVLAHGYRVEATFPDDSSPVWDEENPANLRRVYVVSYNYLAKYYGPQAYWRAVSRDWEAYCDDKDISFQGFDTHAHQENPLNLPEFLEDESPPRISSLAGKFGFVFADECQDGLRNQSSYWRTVRWLSAKFLFLMSGYPAPRGMEDYGSYLALLERPSLRKEYKQFCREMVQLRAHERPWDPDETNPYLLPPDSPYFKFTYLVDVWRKWITPTSNVSFDRRMRQGKMAQPVLETFVLGRNFDSALPAGSSNTIGQSMPPKHHYTVERCYTPEDYRIYTTQFARWKSRLYTTHTAPGRSTKVPATNARATRAIQILDFLPLLGFLHLERPAEKRPSKHALGPGDDRLDEKYNRDRESWFYEKSKLYQTYDQLPRMKPGGKGERIRWLLSTAAHMNCPDLPMPEEIEAMDNPTLAWTVIKRSPKMQAILGLYMDWALLRDEKVIFWFMTPIVQEIAQTVMELLGHSVFSVYSYNNATERAQVADAWNRPKTKKRALFASALVFGTGHNLQKDSRVGVMVDTPDTLNRELQIAGRQYRGGQMLEVHFFRLIVRGSHSVNLLSDNLLASLASATSFIDYNPEESSSLIPSDAPTEIVDMVTSNFLSGYFRVPAKDFPEDAELTDADFLYYFIFSEEGLNYIKEHRKQIGHNDWWPETLHWTQALAGIAARTSTTRLTRLAGFPEECTDAVLQLTEEEIEARREARMEENGGVDPDDKFLHPKTPKKPKADNMSRLTDGGPVSRQITLPGDEGFDSYRLPQDTLQEPDSPSLRPKTVQEYDEEASRRLVDLLPQGDVRGKRARRKDRPTGGAEEQVDDKMDTVSDSHHEEGSDDDGSSATPDLGEYPSMEAIKEAMTKHPTWIPQYNDVVHLTAQEKGKLTSEVKKTRAPDFAGYKAPKGPKTKKGKGKGMSKA